MLTEHLCSEVFIMKQIHYQRKLAEFEEKKRTNTYPSNPVDKSSLSDTREFREYIEKHEELSIKT